MGLDEASSQIKSSGWGQGVPFAEERTARNFVQEIIAGGVEGGIIPEERNFRSSELKKSGVIEKTKKTQTRSNIENLSGLWTRTNRKQSDGVNGGSCKNSHGKQILYMSATLNASLITITTL